MSTQVQFKQAFRLRLLRGSRKPKNQWATAWNGTNTLQGHQHVHISLLHAFFFLNKGLLIGLSPLFRGISVQTMY